VSTDGSTRELTDEEDLGEFGYTQGLKRDLNFWTTWALGFAFVSPVVGLYTVVALGSATAGPAWIWALPIVILGQLLVALIYADLARRWPLAGGIYQWSRRLMGPRYGWWAGWIYLWALVFTLAGVSYAGGFFLSGALGDDAPGKFASIGYAAVVLAILTVVNAAGQWVLKYTVLIGIAAELVASVAVGLTLLLFFREQPVSVLVDTSMTPEGTSFGTAFVATVAFCGWAILGFDACGSVAEETRNPRREVPRAIILSLIPVGIVEVLGACALILASPDLDAVVNGSIADPVAYAVSSALGESVVPAFLIVVVVGFIACGISIQATAVRVIYSFSRDDQLPGSNWWRRLLPLNRLPVNAVLLVTVLVVLTFFYANALSVLVTFAAGAYFLAFTAPVAAVLIRRLQGRYVPMTKFARSKWGLALNVVAIAWLVLETINIAWPRDAGDTLTTWAVLIGLLGFVLLGAAYFFASRPDRRIADQDAGRGLGVGLDAKPDPLPGPVLAGD
jgi:amino acid transporter